MQYRDERNDDGLVKLSDPLPTPHPPPLLFELLDKQLVVWVAALFSTALRGYPFINTL